MPNYNFRHKESQEEKTLLLSMAERVVFLKENPEWEQVISVAPAIGYNDLGTTKPSNNFREKLRKIKKDYPGSNINTF